MAVLSILPSLLSLFVSPPLSWASPLDRLGVCVHSQPARCVLISECLWDFLEGSHCCSSVLFVHEGPQCCLYFFSLCPHIFVAQVVCYFSYFFVCTISRCTRWCFAVAVVSSVFDPGPIWLHLRTISWCDVRKKLTLSHFPI